MSAKRAASARCTRQRSDGAARAATFARVAIAEAEAAGAELEGARAHVLAGRERRDRRRAERVERALFGAFAELAAWIEVDNVRFHATVDPDVAFVEEHMTAGLRDGRRYENDLCLRVTFRDGLIAEIFEYYGERAHEALAPPR